MTDRIDGASIHTRLGRRHTVEVVVTQYSKDASPKPSQVSLTYFDLQIGFRLIYIVIADALYHGCSIADVNNTVHAGAQWAG
jgi:hypothetical protein